MADDIDTTDRDEIAYSDTGRLEAFSDGVLAVAITLLVLDLKVPHVGAGSLWSALGAQWPAYLAYAGSFIMIGVMWLNHHSVFKQIRYVDRGVMLINLVLLMIIVAVPFAASLVADYLGEPGRNAKIAVAVFSSLAAAMAVAYSALWAYVLGHPNLLEPHVDVQLSRKQLPRFALGVVAYPIIIAVSFINAVAAMVMILLLVVYYSFQQLPVGRRS